MIKSAAAIDPNRLSRSIAFGPLLLSDLPNILAVANRFTVPPMNDEHKHPAAAAASSGGKVHRPAFVLNSKLPTKLSRHPAMEPKDPIANGIDKVLMVALTSSSRSSNPFALSPLLMGVSFSSPPKPVMSISARLAGRSLVQQISYTGWDDGASPQLDSTDATRRETTVPLPPPPSSFILSAAVPAAADIESATRADAVGAVGMAKDSAVEDGARFLPGKAL